MAFDILYIYVCARISQNRSRILKCGRVNNILWYYVFMPRWLNRRCILYYNITYTCVWLGNDRADTYVYNIYQTWNELMLYYVQERVITYHTILYYVVYHIINIISRRVADDCSLVHCWRLYISYFFENKSVQLLMFIVQIYTDSIILNICG